MVGLQFNQMMAGATNVRCICPDGGPPAVGQCLILCKTCKVWQHQVCVVGPSLNLGKGFDCHLCVKQRHTVAGRKGRDNRARREAKAERKEAVGFDYQQPAASANHGERTGTAKRRKRPSKPLEEEEEELDLPPPKRVQMTDKAKRLGKTSRDAQNESLTPDLVPRGEIANPQSRRLTRRQSKLAAPSKTTCDSGKEALSGLGLDSDEISNLNGPLRSFLSQASPQFPVSASSIKLLSRVLDGAQNPATSTNVHCECGDHRSTSIFDYMLCHSCRKWQHKKCLQIPVGQEGLFKGFNLCNSCRVIKTRKFMRAMELYRKDEEADQERQGEEMEQEYEGEEMQQGYERQEMDRAYAGQEIEQGHDNSEMQQEYEGEEVEQEYENEQIEQQYEGEESEHGYEGEDMEDEHEYEQMELKPESQKTKEELLRDFIETTLWKIYCDLPNGPNPASGIVELTSTYYDRGKMIPIHPAPKWWSDEIYKNIDNILQQTGHGANEGAGADNVGPKYGEKFLVTLRKSTVWALHHGTYLRKRDQLGVLAEVLGLEKKGKFWKN